MRWMMPPERLMTSKRSLHLALVAGTALSLGATALAGPEGERVISGQASFARGGGQTTITTSRVAVIDYTRFNIGMGESVRFVQPDASSRVLNRVTGPGMSRIDGNLSANGRVYLVNPAGVMIGRDATINAAGFHAAAGRLSDSDFLAGVDHYTDLSGSVINEGQIEAASIALIGRSVENIGSLKAEGGTIALVVGGDVLIREGDDGLYVRVDGRDVGTAPGTANPGTNASRGREQASLSNTGTISASRGVVTLGAGDSLALAIQNKGRIDAAGGRVTLDAKSGTLRNEGAISAGVSDGKAGSVTLQGPRVVVTGSVDADAGAGTAGDVRVVSSRSTTLADGSRVSASGGEGVASGGTVLVHSLAGDTLMTRGAVVDLSGGVLGGDGGVGEISGAGRLGVLGTIAGGVAEGFKAASVVLDPTDIVIRTPGVDDVQILDGVVVGGDPGLTFQISPAAIEGFAGDVSLEATRDIRVLESISKVNGSLMLLAGRDIVLGSIMSPLGILANAIDFTAARHIRDFSFGGAHLKSSVGDIRTTATTGSVKFGTATIAPGRTLYLTQGQSRYFKSGPWGLVDDSSNANIVIRVTNGWLILGGDSGGYSGYQTIGSLDAWASDYLRVEDDIDITTTARLRSLGDVQFDGFVHAGVSIEAHAGLDGSGDVRFLTPGLSLWADSIALRAGSGAGLGVARVDVLSGAPELRATGGGATRPAAFTFEQDAAVTDADLASTSQFGAGLAGMIYRIESYDASVTLGDTSRVNGTGLTLGSQTGTTIADALDVQTLDVEGTSLLDADVSSVGYQAYQGAVTLGGDRLLKGSLISLGSTLDATTAGGQGLSVQGDLLAMDAIGATARLSYLIVDGASTLNGGSIRTEGDQRFNGDVALGAHTELTSEGNGVIRFGGLLDGAFDLRVTTTENGLIVFAGDVGSIAALRDVDLSTAGSDAVRGVADAATIVGENDLRIRVREFRMGQHEKFTTLGSIRIDATQSAVLGDMTSLGDMTVIAPSITLLLREASTLLDSASASVADRGLDFVSGGRIDFQGAITLSGGSNPAPTFADLWLGSHGVLDGYEFTQPLAGDVSLAGLTLGQP